MGDKEMIEKIFIWYRIITFLLFSLSIFNDLWVLSTGYATLIITSLLFEGKMEGIFY